MADKPADKPRDLTDAEVEFLWDRCVNHDHGLMAKAGGKLDERLDSLVETGAVKCYDSMFGNNYYTLTPLGKDAIKPRRGR